MQSIEATVEKATVELGREAEALAAHESKLGRARKRGRIQASREAAARGNSCSARTSMASRAFEWIGSRCGLAQMRQVARPMSRLARLAGLMRVTSGIESLAQCSGLCFPLSLLLPRRF